MKITKVLQLIDVIHQKHGTSEPYLCGGLPRDKYLKKIKTISDIDITTGDKTVNKLSLETFKILKDNYDVPRSVGIDGHTSIQFKNLKIDFSSNFIDPEVNKYLLSNGKRLSSLEQETYSRDFGCNALLLDFNLKDLKDPTNRGIKDCNNKIIKTLVPPQITFRPTGPSSVNNRIIRGIYLACKLDFTIDKQIVEYVSNNPKLITMTERKTLSKKINSAYASNPEKMIYYFDKMNLWNYIPINSMLSDEVVDLFANRINYEKR